MKVNNFLDSQGSEKVPLFHGEIDAFSMQFLIY